MQLKIMSDNLDCVQNFKINKHYYEQFYSKIDIQGNIYRAQNYQAMFKKYMNNGAFGFREFYFDNLIYTLANKKVLELGFGDGLHTLLLAQYGAQVTAVEISSTACEALDIAAHKLGINNQITIKCGDFKTMDLQTSHFDYVFGKAFLHHLTEEQELVYLQKIACLLHAKGEARFSEPAVNSVVLDQIRWMIPVSGRPSKLQKKAFEQWKKNDHHPDRDNSSLHFKTIGNKFFKQVFVRVSSAFSRIERLAPNNSKRGRQLKRIGDKLDDIAPYFIKSKVGRAQLIIYKEPK